jgi:ketosteroid isomerase-like protein
VEDKNDPCRKTVPKAPKKVLPPHDAANDTGSRSPLVWHPQLMDGTPYSRAVALARSHLEAWTNHDFDTVRSNLADDVQFFSPAANLVGIDEYMDAPRGLTQFARQVVPGSLRVIAAMGDELNALIMYEVSTRGGPIGSKVFPSAQTWLLDDSGKIKVERIVSYMVPRTG